MSDETGFEDTEPGIPQTHQVEVGPREWKLDPVARPTDLVAQMVSYLGRACSKYAMRDQVSYAAGMHLMGSSPQQMVPVIAVTLAIPALVIDQHMQGTVMTQDLFMSEDQVETMVHDMLENLRNARISQASQFGQHPNGQPPL